MKLNRNEVHKCLHPLKSPFLFYALGSVCFCLALFFPLLVDQFPENLNYGKTSTGCKDTANSNKVNLNAELSKIGKEAKKEKLNSSGQIHNVVDDGKL